MVYIYMYAANGAHFICHIRLLYVNSIAQIIKNTCSCSYIFGSSDYICRMWVWRRTLNVPVCVGHSHSCYIQLMETSSHHQNVKRMPKFTNPIIVLFVSIFSTFRTISHWYIDLYLISRIVEFSVHRKKKKNTKYVHRFDTPCVRSTVHANPATPTTKNTIQRRHAAATTTTAKLTQVVNYFVRLFLPMGILHSIEYFGGHSFRFFSLLLFIEKSVFRKLDANYEEECPLIRYK